MSLKDQFDRDGFLVLPDLFSAAECDTLITRGRELASEYGTQEARSVFQTTEQSKTTDDYFLNSGNKIACFFEKDAFNEQGELRSGVYESLNKIGHALHDLDPVFAAFSRAPQLQQLATSIGLADALLIQSMLIFKHARVGGVVDIHQDASFLYTTPESCVGFWFALEDATVENGCLWARAGGHQTELRCWFKRKPEGGTEMQPLTDTPWDWEGMQPLEVKKGTCIVLHGLLPHYSKPNSSGKSRQAYAIHTISPTAHYPVENWLQRPISDLRSFLG